MATIHREGNLDLLSGKVAVLGYGSQGHAHALNLHDSGVEVEVGLREGSSSAQQREEAGPHRRDRRRGGRSGAQLVSILLPDQVQPGVYERRRRAEPRSPDAALLFAHGFNVHYGRIAPPEGHDVIMVAPKGPGHIVRRLFRRATARRRSSRSRRTRAASALDLALAYGAAIGAGRAGIIETTFAEETETDLFGEQAVLCGGVTELIRAGFETLVEAGYQPEIAYYECLHELKLIVDLIYEGGLAGHALLDLRHGRVRRPHARPARDRRARAREHAQGDARGHPGRRVRTASGSPRWTRASRACTSCASRRPTSRSSWSARSCAALMRREPAEVHGVR